MDTSRTDLNNKYPINVGNIKNAAEAPFTVTIPSLHLRVGESGNPEAVPFFPESGCSGEMLQLKFHYKGEDQDLFINYTIEPGFPPSFLLNQRDKRGFCRQIPVSGLYHDGDIELTIVDDGGVLIIGTVVIDVEENQ